MPKCELRPAIAPAWRIVADRAISKGKDVTLVLFRFMTLTATTPASERPEPTQAAEPPQGR